MSDLCAEIPTGYLLCVIVWDCRLSVANTLIANFNVFAWDMKGEMKRDWGLKMQQFAENQAAVNRYDIAVRAAECANQFGAQELDFTNEAHHRSVETPINCNACFQSQLLRKLGVSKNRANCKYDWRF